MHMHYPVLNSCWDAVAKLKVAAEFTKNNQEWARYKFILDNFMKN
jgi:hypothetical protein